MEKALHNKIKLQPRFILMYRKKQLIKLEIHLMSFLK